MGCLLGGLMLLAACERVADGPTGVVRDWAPYTSLAEGYVVFAPRKLTVSEIKVPTPVGEMKIPVTYFMVDNNIFYVSSHPRDARMGGTDEQILDAQAQGILAKFEKVEVRREPFVSRGRRGLRLLLTRPDSYKIVELYVTPSTLYQVVTDLPSSHAAQIDSFLFRATFTILK